MTRVRQIVAAAALTLCPVILPAQREDPTQQLLDYGRTEFDKFSFRTADSVAMETLRIPNLRRMHRLQALQLAAASRYPAENGPRYPDSALVALRQLVRIAPAVSLPGAYTWYGLDTLYAAARRSVFGASASVPDTVVTEGVLGAARFDVVASRPAIFLLHVAPADASGRVTRVDSIGPIERGNIGFMPVGGDRPTWPSGRYRMTIVAIDPSTGERIERAYRAAFETPPVQLEEVPTVWDRSGTVPEHTRPARTRSIISGVVMGGFVFATTNLLQSKAHKDGNVDPNSNSLAWGIGLGALTTGLSWYLDRGRPILPNIRYNTTLAENFRMRQAGLTATNEQARIGYTGRLRFTPEEL